MKGLGAAFCQLPWGPAASHTFPDPSEQFSQHHRHFISKASALTPEHTSSAHLPSVLSVILSPSLLQAEGLPILLDLGQLSPG